MKKGIDNFLTKEAEKEKQEVRVACDMFYPNEVLAEFGYSSDSSIAEELYAMSQVSESTTLQFLTQNQLEEECILIKDNVKQGRAENIEIRFDQMTQLFERKKYPLEKTVLRICTWDDGAESRYIFIKDGNTLALRVFIGGENAMAIMAIRNGEGKVGYIRLSQFHLLSIRENLDPQKEIGLVTSYIWLTAKVFSSVVLACNLAPIKCLLLSDWLQTEWQKAKEISMQFPEEMPGGDVDG